MTSPEDFGINKNRIAKDPAASIAHIREMLASEAFVQETLANEDGWVFKRLEDGTVIERQESQGDNDE